MFFQLKNTSKSMLDHKNKHSRNLVACIAKLEFQA